MRGCGRTAFLALVHGMFLLSGAAALVYQVVWTRSLGLAFGGSHLAVTTVLAVFMGGLALGGLAFGRRARTRLGFSGSTAPSSWASRRAPCCSCS